MNSFNQGKTHSIKWYCIPTNNSLFAANQREWWLYFLIASVTFGRYILNLLVAVALRIPLLRDISSYIPNVIICLSIVLAFPLLTKRLKYVDLLVFICILVIYLLQYIFFPSNSQYLDEYFGKVFFTAIPFYYIGCIIDIKKLDKLFLILSVITLFLYVYHDLFYTQEIVDDDRGEYKMGIAYGILPTTVYVAWSTLRKFKILPFFALLSSGLLLFSYGTRGPILCLVVFILLFILFFYKGKYKWLIVGIITALVLYALLNIESLIGIIGEKVSSLGGSTRLLSYVIEDKLADDSGRSDIIRCLQTLLSEGDHPFGFGLFASWRYTGGYAHRIHWDLWFSFGYFLGTFFMFLIIVPMLKGWRKTKEKTERGFLFVLFCIGFLPLMLSGYFLFYSNFFLFMGYCVSRTRDVQLPEI